MWKDIAPSVPSISKIYTSINFECHMLSLAKRVCSGLVPCLEPTFEACPTQEEGSRFWSSWFSAPTEQTPCITADRDGDSSGNGNDCSSADSAFPSADSDARVPASRRTGNCQMWEEQTWDREESTWTESQRTLITSNSVRSRKFTSKYCKLSARGPVPSPLGISQSLTTLQASKFGVNLILNNTCYYTGLATYDLFLSLYNMLKPFHVGVANINHFFATLLYLRLSTPMIDLRTRLQKDSKSTVSRMFHSWIETMHHNLRPLVTWPDTETLRRNLPNAFKKHFSGVKCIVNVMYKIAWWYFETICMYI